MTDADLIAALGWEPCERVDENACVIHGVWFAPPDSHCTAMLNRLQGARAGIDLAKHGIADAIKTTHVPGDPAGYASDFILREAVLRWTP